MMIFVRFEPAARPVLNAKRISDRSAMGEPPLSLHYIDVQELAEHIRTRAWWTGGCG